MAKFYAKIRLQLEPCEASMAQRPKTPAEYYASTASSYDDLHVHKDDEHYIGLRYASAIISCLGAQSILDVGSGTGRAVEYFLHNHPAMRVVGVEPVAQLREIAIRKRRLPVDSIVSGNGLHLPFADSSFDVVSEFGVLHHVETPNLVVLEMMRVARRAVILSDENRFAFGNAVTRWLKVLLYKAGMFKMIYKLVTKGRGYRYSAEDGVAYSYSVFDSLEDLSGWGDRLMMIGLDRSASDPEHKTSKTLFYPTLGSFRMLLASIRDL